jgi:hypothetical protein
VGGTRQPRLPQPAAGYVPISVIRTRVTCAQKVQFAVDSPAGERRIRTLGPPKRENGPDEQSIATVMRSLGYTRRKNRLIEGA